MAKKIVALGACAGMVLGATAVVPAQAKTVKACVNKKTGEIRIGKKCKKGWKKVTWNQQGAVGPQGSTGPTGADGPLTVVKDATGKTVGRLLGLFPSGLNIMFVLIDGGSYIYTPDGKVMSLGSTSPNFTAVDCSGTAFIPSSSPTTTALLTGSAGGPTRIVYRKTNPTLGPTLAWQITATTQAINTNIYKFDDTGACVADGTHNGTIVLLAPVSAPVDVPGPLTIG